MKKSINRILNIIYPRHCPVCHNILKDQKGLVCPGCEDVFVRVGRHYCLKCGKPVKEQEEYCRECQKRNRSFDRNKSVFVYDSRLRQSLVRYKYYGCREYSDYYSYAVCTWAGAEIRVWKPDVIVPVPMTAAKQRQRGYNQAGCLADRIGERMGIPVSHTVLKKIRRTSAQKKLNGAERRRNLRNAFQVQEEIRGLVILVIDDVYTTGSTMEAAASCLKAAGAKKVFGITLCTGQG